MGGFPLRLPEELVMTLSHQWPWRELQIRQLACLLGPALPSPPAIIVHGPQGSGKSSVLTALLTAYNEPTAADSRNGRDEELYMNAYPGARQGGLLPYAIVKCAECITARHLLGKIVAVVILGACASASFPDEDARRIWAEDTRAKARCDHISSLPGVLRDVLDSVGCEKFVLVMDGIDSLREGGQMLLAALGRLGELVPSICVVFVMKASPRPLLLQVAGIPHVHFPPYSRNQAISILAASQPSELPGLPPETSMRIYPPFISTVYDSLIGPTASTIPVFRSACEKLWPRFVAPITNNEKPPGFNPRAQWDFSRLLVRNRALFQHQGEEVLVHHIIADETPTLTTNVSTSTSSIPFSGSKSSSPFPSLPYLPTLILTSAFLAAHIPPRLDTIFFSKFSSSSLSARNKRAHHRRRLKVLSQAQAQEQDLDTPEAAATSSKSPSTKRRKSKHTKITKSALSSALASSSSSGNAGAGFINPRPFPLERLLAIYRAIDPNPNTTSATSKPIADTIYPELATLQRLRLLVPASSAGGADGAEKWCLNASVAVSSSSTGPSEWIAEMARGIGIEVGEYLAGGLD
ncbi:origin recognition complex subunit 5 [[Emmonsia] crescens]|uniref:Origin recognition complex subunit 5 n=1 Tax=[Emmonsia] crescens TaxID=73230 RepID=A0A2B7ZEP5_9EURO|nr:origin recognition complex subunit 5 [Emmonsia crescens]